MEIILIVLYRLQMLDSTLFCTLFLSYYHTIQFIFIQFNSTYLNTIQFNLIQLI